MSLSESMAISASALDAHRQRLSVIASNLANAQSTRTMQGGPYQRKMVVFEAQIPSNGGQPARERPSRSGQVALPGVAVTRVIDDPTPGPRVFNPSHPDANAQGFVDLPNVNVLTEMVDMMAASRAYEANVKAMEAARTMTLRAMEIGR